MRIRKGPPDTSARRRLPALILAIVAAAHGAPQPSSPPQRIISTAPSITEILYALGLGPRVAGVTRFCRYPPEAQLKPKIGDYINPNLEAIAALKPDLVIIQNNPVRLAQRLSTLRLRTLEVRQESLADIYAAIAAIAQSAGVPARGEQLNAALRAKLDAIRARSAPLKRTRVMFVVGRAPGRLDGIIVAGKGSYLNEILTLAGGENVFGDTASAYPQVSLEEVLARDPEVVIDLGDMGEADVPADRQKREVISAWQRAPSLRAVKNHRVFAASGGMYSTPGPRAADAAQSIFAMLHPEAH